MHKILRRGWIGLLVFVVALTLANFLLHIVEAGHFDRHAAISKAEHYRGEIIRSTCVHEKNSGNFFELGK